MKLNRKWLLAIALVLSMTTAISGTLAYLTDRDTVENTFTLGNVDIEVVEDFTTGTQLMPGVTVDKTAGIMNTHDTEPAYVWMVVSVPSYLAEHIILDWAGDYSATSVTSPHADEGYTGYVVKYDGALAAGASTGDMLEGVMLKSYVDYQDGEYVKVENGVTTTINDSNGQPADLSNVKIIVDGYAMQTVSIPDMDGNGKVDVEDAYLAYNAQWNGLDGGESTGPVEVGTIDELVAALADGSNVTLTGDIDMSTYATRNMRLDIPENANVTIDLNGHTLTSKDGGGKNTMAIYVNRGATLTMNDSVGTGKLVASCYGVYVQPNATFIMNGGEINVSGNGVYDIGVTVWNGAFVMNGGTINAKFAVWTSNYWKNNGEPAAATCAVIIAEDCKLNSTSGIDIDIGDAPDARITAPTTIKVGVSADG